MHTGTKRNRIKMLSVAVTAFLIVLAAFLMPLESNAGGNDHWEGLEDLTFAKIDEEGNIIRDVEFRLVDSKGNDLSYDIIKLNSTAITFKITDLADMLSEKGDDYYVKLIEDAPEGYASIDPIIIKLAPGAGPYDPGILVNDYKLTSSMSGAHHILCGALNDEEYRVGRNTIVTEAYFQKNASRYGTDPANFLIVNYRELKIAKKDDDGKFVEGAELEITGKTVRDHTIKPVKITTDKEILTTGLPAGDYTLTEITPPTGYSKADPIDFHFEDGIITVGGKNVGELTMIDPKIKNPKLSIRKTSNIKAAKPGDIIPFIITVKNSGDGDATDVNILDTMGADLEYCSDSANGTNQGKKVEWTIDVPAGTTREITIECRILGSAVGKVINNVEITNVESEFLEPNEDSDEFTVVLGESEDTEATTSVEKDGKSGGSKTGDGTYPVAAIFALAASLALIAINFIRRRRV